MINEDRIKDKVKKAIAIKPTHITLIREVKTGNGMRGGGTPKPDKVGELDIFFDDSKHNLLLDSVKESGIVKRTRGLSMLAVTEGFEIKYDDYFTVGDNKYRVTYPGMLVKDVYNADLEVVK